MCSADISKCKRRIRVATWLTAIFAVFFTIVTFGFTAVPGTPTWYTTLPANVGLFCSFTSVGAFYATWLFYPVDKPKSCKAMLRSWQTALMAAVLIVGLVVRSFDFVILFAHLVDGNKALEASRLGHVGSDSFKVFHHYPTAEVISTEYRLATADTYTTAGTTDRIGTIEVTGLAPATEYYYRVLVDGEARVEDTKLVTAPVEGTPVKFTFTFGSCYMGQSMYSGVTWPVFRIGMMNFFDRLCGL